MAWSPDGSTLLCEGWDNADPTTLRGCSRSTSRRASSHASRRNRAGGHDIPTDYSPDGTQIVFARENPGRGAVALFVAAPDGTDATRITPWSDTTGGGRWSPDGSRILFTEEGRLRTVAPDGTGLTADRRPTSAKGRPRSTGGRMVARRHPDRLLPLPRAIRAGRPVHRRRRRHRPRSADRLAASPTSSPTGDPPRRHPS